MTRRSLRRDLDRFAEVYNAAWSDNWGFVPYSKRDLDFYAQEMQLAFDRNWYMVAETADGDTAAVAITAPDVNQVLKKMNGRLLPLGWWHYLRRAKTIDRVRVGFLGVKPEYQHTGVAAALYVEHFDTATRVPAEVGRDGLDPRDQPQHEPRDGGDGRPHRAAFSGLRAGSCRVVVCMDRSEFLKASPPMFKSGLLDRFTRVHHLVPVVIFLPAIVLLFATGVGRVGLAARRSAARVGGYAFWTLAEYWIHRVIFHFEPEHGIGARLHWMIHGVHHDHPNDPLRLVMPPAASVPLALVFYALFWLVLGADRAIAFGAGFLAGYLAYDMIHYHLHHHSPRTRLGRWLRELHMRHHFQDDERGFGISAPYWDRVFGTMHVRRGR